MCGICGMVMAHGGGAVDRGVLQAMNEYQAHRGPDGEGLFIEGGVGLGHRRLSIIDLEGGGQPIYNEDNSLVIVFNGEIYNYKELRRDLMQRGHRFSTDSDTETIVHLYEEKGAACVDDLNGMFAFALWDRSKRRLFIARDRFGEKPLYYHIDNKGLYFSSELKSLRKTVGSGWILDPSSLDEYLAYGYIAAPRTIYRNVYKLPPAHSMIWDASGLHLERYWSVTFPERSLDIGEAEALEALQGHLSDSIRLRLRSDVPVGAFLSGGIDSSLMVSLAAPMSERRLTTFSVGFSERDFDELASARLVAEAYETDHHEIVIEDLDLSLFPEIVEHFDEPFGDPSAIPTYYVTREASRALKVCISGDGGDEFFCGYERYQWEPGERLFDHLPEKLRSVVLGAVADGMPQSFSGKGFLGRMAVSGERRYSRKVAAFERRERTALFLPEFHAAIGEEGDLLRPYFENRLDAVAQRMLADQNLYLSEDILVKVDRNSMWHGLEVRVPFLDHRLVDFANSLPMALKKRNRTLKYLLRRLLEGRVPSEITQRGKQGFGLPLSYWMKGRLEEFSRELLLSSDSHSQKYFDLDVIRGLIDDHQTGRRDLSRRIWTLLWFEQWCRSECR